jgi:hypothetical protein
MIPKAALKTEKHSTRMLVRRTPVKEASDRDRDLHESKNASTDEIDMQSVGEKATVMQRPLE